MDSHQLLSGLPWDGLASQLSSSAALIDGTPEKYIEECTQTFLDLDDISNHDLVQQPSGLCMNTLVNGYEQSDIIDSDQADDLVSFYGLKIDNVFDPPQLEESEDALAILQDPANERFNLPYKVLKAKSVGDIVAGVSFAAEHGVKVSVKNVGNSFAGASTGKDSLMIHTNSLPKYSHRRIEECIPLPDDSDVSSDLSNQPCKMALSRNKPAVVRVGGGETWAGVYTSVKAENERIKGENGGRYKYHTAGGAVPVVSPMGWTWQGGLAATQMGRELGFGVDQVLQLEMVLPDGSHVKFGPSKWEDASADGYRYPRTTEVTGVCNSNPHAEDESEFIWEPCTNDVDFADLWFAVRGGGGGTWGVVVSTYLQLHEYPGKYVQVLPLNLDRQPESIGALEALLPYCDALGVGPEKCADIHQDMVLQQSRFFLDALLFPDRVTNFTATDSARCAKPTGMMIFCFGDAAEALLEAYAIRLSEQRDYLVNERGWPNDFVNSAAGYLGILEEGIDIAEGAVFPEGHRLAGLGEDGSNPPTWLSRVLPFINPIIPKQVIADNYDYFVSLFADKDLFSLSYFFRSYFAHVDKTDDQMSSLSQAHREGAFMFGTIETSGEVSDALWELMFGEMDFDGDFPGYLGSNHLGPISMGPIKSDWTKSCPMDWSWEKRAAECFSPQEAVYGTRTLQRLEQIKTDIDPYNLFQCNTCIGTPVRGEKETSSGKKTKKVASSGKKSDKGKKTKKGKKTNGY